MRSFLIMPDAEKDAESIARRLAEESKKLAKGFNRELLKAWRAIIANPRAGSPADCSTIEGELRYRRLRRFSKYAVYYLIEPDSIVVLRVWHGSRNPSWLNQEFDPPGSVDEA